jgi:hypothetical protein
MHLPRLSLKWSLALVGASALVFTTGCSASSSPSGAPDYGGVTGSSGGGNGATGSSGSSSGGTAGSGSGSSSGSGSGGGSGSSSGASSGGSGSSSGGAAMTLGTGTWTDGQTLAESVIIGAGATITIDPAATINVGAGVTITVLGTLTASSAATHAKITGTSWTGIVVASGGTLSLDGVDLVNAGTALSLQKGGNGEYDDGTITAATTPFSVDAGGALTTKHSVVAGTLGSTSISGSFTASYLDYDSNGHAGITTQDPTAQLSIEDSTLHGSGPTADFLVSGAGAAKFHIAYTNISNVHCGFHFDTVSEFDVSYSNIEGNAYGFMLYGSGGAGPFTVTYSNLYSNASYDYDTEGTNSPITFDHDYTADATNPGDAVTTTNAQTAKVTGTGPR